MTGLCMGSNASCYERGDFFPSIQGNSRVVEVRKERWTIEENLCPSEALWVRGVGVERVVQHPWLSCRH